MRAPVTLGSFVEKGSAPISGLEVTFPALDLIAHWRRCGSAADHLASHLAYDFENRDVATNVLSTVINEVLENAAKFAADKKAPIRISVHHLGETVRIEAENAVEPARAEKFKEHLEKVLSGDPERMFVEHVKLGTPTPPGTPGIGLVVLRKDYAAKIGARFRPGADGNVDVSVQVFLSPQDVEQR